MKSLVRREVERFDWSGFHCSCGDARHLSNDLLVFTDPETPSAVFEFTLEDHIVPDGLLLEAAVPVVSVMMSALVADLKFGTRSRIMDLLWRVSGGEPRHDAINRGSSRIGDECQALMRQGIWHFYSWLAIGDAEVAIEILDSIEKDAGRLEYYRAAYGVGT